MQARYLDVLSTPPEPIVALGGGPVAERDPASEQDGKSARKRRKHEAKLRRDAERPPGSFERFRILIDIIDEARRVTDMADHKARYALVVMGVLNAGVFFLLSRAHLISTLSAQVRPWLIGFLVAYAGLTFLFVLHAIDCLRPRQMRETGLAADAAEASNHGALGLLYWETIARYDLETYRKAWSGVRMEQLNAELVLIQHHLSRLIKAKYAALGRLYRGLAVLVALAAAQLVVYSAFTLRP